jgi:hypothetical protein
MADDLFREEALAYQSASSAQFGETTGLLPPSWGRITLLFAVFMAALLVFRPQGNRPGQAPVRWR